MEVNRSDHLNMIFNPLIEKVEQMKLKSQKQSDIRSFLRYILFVVFTRVVQKKSSILISVIFFGSKNPQIYIVNTWL